MVLTSSALLLTLSLAGCNTMNDAAQFGSSTVGTGVKYGANTVGAGVGFLANTGAAVGSGVGSVVNTGYGVVTSPMTHFTGKASNKQVVYHNGHRYLLKNGKYVRM